MQENDIVEPTVSAWNSPIILVPKKDPDAKGQKQYRVCIDYRGLNAVVEPDRYPLPNIHDLLDKLNNAKYFTCMDLSQGYYQAELEEASRPMTAFVTPDGEHYQMTRMPMGLSTSPAAFMRMMNMALSGLVGAQCLVYIDDLIVFSKTAEDHLTDLAMVFQRLREVNLKINPDKTYFMQESVVFLGFQVSAQGISVDPNKFETIREYPTPRTKKQTERFVELLPTVHPELCGEG